MTLFHCGGMLYQDLFLNVRWRTKVTNLGNADVGYWCAMVVEHGYRETRTYSVPFLHLTERYRTWKYEIGGSVWLASDGYRSQCRARISIEGWSEVNLLTNGKLQVVQKNRWQACQERHVRDWTCLTDWNRAKCVVFQWRNGCAKVYNTRQWREAHLEVKTVNNHQVRSTFWKFRCPKRARCCGAKMREALLQVKMEKKSFSVPLDLMMLKKCTLAQSAFGIQNCKRHSWSRDVSWC